MAKEVIRRRGTTAEHADFTGAEGEVTVDTTKDTLVVHDGSTEGGFPLAKESALGTIASQDSDAVAITGGDITGITDLTVADGGTGASTFTDHGVMLGSGAAALSATATGTNGQIFTSNGVSSDPTFQDAGGGFPSGTLMLFQQTSAPTGWTKETTHNNKSLRVVSGTASSGGSSSFTSVFGSGKTAGSRTLTTAQMPSHTHTQRASGQTADSVGRVSGNTNNVNVGQTLATGGGGSHNHTLSLDLQYVDLIIASKD